MNDQQSQAKEACGSTNYTPPKLTIYGSVEALTGLLGHSNLPDAVVNGVVMYGDYVGP